MKPQTLDTTRPLTLADLCEAIAGGQLVAPIEDGYYTISRRALRQLRPAADLRRVSRPVRLARPTRIAS
ncbi:MAG: hypothetical protein M3Z04_12610 [Chloroflexota bacterium]|nr:hypothetical protein [Chloroflexota bacterium]